MVHGSQIIQSTKRMSLAHLQKVVRVYLQLRMSRQDGTSHRDSTGLPSLPSRNPTNPACKAQQSRAADPQSCEKGWLWLTLARARLCALQAWALVPSRRPRQKPSAASLRHHGTPRRSREDVGMGVAVAVFCLLTTAHGSRLLGWTNACSQLLRMQACATASAISCQAGS